MLKFSLHHTKYPILRRMYQKKLAMNYLYERAKVAPLNEKDAEILRYNRASVSADKMLLRYKSKNSITLDDINQALDELLALPQDKAITLLDKWERRARQR